MKMKNTRDFLRKFIPTIENEIKQNLAKSKQIQTILDKRWSDGNSFLNKDEYQFLLDYGVVSKGKSTLVSPLLTRLIRSASLSKQELTMMLDQLKGLGVIVSYDSHALNKPRTLTDEKLEIEIDMVALGELIDNLFKDKPIKARPSNWKLIKKNKRADLTESSNIVISFPQVDSERFLIFEHLWNNFDREIELKEIYELSKQHSYKIATKAGKTKVNELLRAQVRSLRKNLEPTPFTIVTDKSFRLTLSQ